MVSSTGRLGRAALATGLALVLLSGAGGTSALWTTHTELEPGNIHAGGVSVTVDDDASLVELHSRQPVSSRTYASSTACTPSSGDYKECRVITGTIANEALIPGDRIVITEKVTLAAQGSNLKGTFGVSVGALTDGDLSAFSGSAATVTTITPPVGSPGTTTSFPIVAQSNQGLGTYTIRSSITTPLKHGAAGWGTALQGQQLYEGAHTFTFTQTN